MHSPNLMPVLLSVLITSAPFSGLLAQAGTLDVTFDGDGRVITDHMSAYNEAWDVTVQPDGRIVAVGYVATTNQGSNFALMRYLPDGTLDSSFSTDGAQDTDFFGSLDFATAVALQSDGKIVVAGYTIALAPEIEFAVARYHTDGTLDTTFGGVGWVTVDIIDGFSNEATAMSVALQPDGKIVVAGSSNDGGITSDIALVRLHPDGTLDTDLDGDGKLTTAIGTADDVGHSVAVLPNGKIVVAGSTSSGADWDIAAVRYNADGTLDNSFSFDGKVITAIGPGDDLCWSMALQSQGKIVLAGYSQDGSNYDFALVQYNSDGTLDTGFDGDGIVTTDMGNSEFGRAVAIQSDGKIVAAGSASTASDEDFAVVRYHANGTLDTDFYGDGTVSTDFGGSEVARAVALQPDGKIVLAGTYYAPGVGYDFALARYLSGLNVGVIDLAGPGRSVLVYPNPIGDEAVLQYELSKEERISIRLHDLEGKLLHTFMENRIQGAGEHHQRIALPQALARGAYVLVVSSSAGEVSIRIVR